VAAVRELKRLSDKFDLANAAAAEFYVVAGSGRGGIFDTTFGQANVFQRVCGIDVFAKDG
jgi:hypothetical protein